MYCKNLIVLLLLIFLAASTLAMGKSPTTNKAFDFTLFDLDGKEHSLSDFRGKIILLNFWTTWCPYCRVEMPSMQALYDSWDKDKYVMLAINTGQHPSAAEAFIKNNKYTFPVLVDPDGSVGRKYYVRSLPTTYIIASDGTIKNVIFGARSWNMDLIKELLK